MAARDRPRRRFTLADLMIVVAAAGVGAMFLRWLGETPTFVLLRVPWPWAYSFLLGLCPFLVVAPLALLAMRARAPRPPWRRIFRQPGAVACLAVVADVVSHDLLFGVRAFINSLRESPFRFGIEYYFNPIFYAGRAVALAWAILALAHIWHPEPGWIDRAGRAFGVAMIGLWLLVTIRF
jgi:hypothetical protein